MQKQRMKKSAKYEAKLSTLTKAPLDEGRARSYLGGQKLPAELVNVKCRIGLDECDAYAT